MTFYKQALSNKVSSSTNQVINLAVYAVAALLLGLMALLIFNVLAPVQVEPIRVNGDSAARYDANLPPAAFLLAGATSPLFTDHRLNSHEAAAPAAIYCTLNGIEVWTIDRQTGRGTLAFTATAAEVARISSTPRVNTLIESGRSFSLYRLVGGNFQVNGPNFDGTLYVFIFSPLDPGRERCPK